ncbi:MULTISPECIES: YeeE/YedE family protein [unclassified Rummeliibacillus]|uniref:YeeE/YedE family protein n=1 Tax=unclassified Rummeliibacillus TaxID=2622809 RepID=UPI000E675D08|nr:MULTISPECIES: YeeE/YedE family protein [unclassified Rummeliibacillus]RIJ63398.1 YeeE/YedE family protein [Rummeliibacillus sp. POC4]RPJ95639.1 YeeE/YedE family protein [Rummeliibacillus sp. TYF005]
MVQMVITGLLCGAALGFVLQRGRFCLTGGFRDMYLTKNNRMFYALLLAIAIQSVGVYALIQFGLLQYEAGTFSWVAIVIGSFIFGIGIVLAGGCATGTWYRAAEGLIGSWIALIFYMLTSAMMKSGVLLPLNEKLSSVQVHNNSIPKTFGVNVWVFIAILVIIVAVIMFKEARKPKLVIPSLKPKKSGIAHLLFERRWHPYFTASIVGIIAIIAWPLSEATGRNSGLGITTPSANILQYLVSGDKSILNWGVFLVLGIFVGSFIAAKGSNEFRLRVPEVKTIVSSVCGGSLMGLGASLAGGCTIGNGLVSTAMMTWQGWIALAFMILGAWTATYFVFVRPRVKKQVVAKQAVTPASAN